MKTFRKYSISITSLFSAVLAVIALVSYNLIFPQIEVANTGDIRNIGLLLIAFAGIPFLILGHNTKRRDLQEKRKDIALKTDTILFSSLSQSILENRDRLNQLFEEIDKSLHLEQSSVKKSSNDRFVLNDYLSDLDTKQKGARGIGSLRKDLSYWADFSSISLTVSYIMKAANEISSLSLRDMIFSSIAININEHGLTILFIVALAFDESNNMLGREGSQGNSYYYSLRSDAYRDFLNSDFLQQIHNIDKRYSRYAFS